MNAIKLLTNTVDSLWIWTYSIVAGWGLTVTVIVVALVFILIRTINLQKRINKLEERLVHAERDYNITLSKWQK
jgi:ABC-type bacteriocin/lantibiotic exporter with double-glycine peptidase domain